MVSVMKDQKSEQENLFEQLWKIHGAKTRMRLTGRNLLLLDELLMVEGGRIQVRHRMSAWPTNARSSSLRHAHARPLAGGRPSDHAMHLLGHRHSVLPAWGPRARWMAGTHGVPAVGHSGSWHSARMWKRLGHARHHDGARELKSVIK